MAVCAQSPSTLKPPTSDTLARLQALVEEDPGDFGAWTALITEIEKNLPDDIEKLYSVYDSFLSEFPLCYGYWCKYAGHKARLSTLEDAVEVYERGVQSATYSVDLWASYCSSGVQWFEDPADVRSLFERGLSFVGKDYLCHLLWDGYLEFEYSQEQWANLAHIYVRTLRFPIKKLNSYYESFKKLVALWEEEIEFQDSGAKESLSDGISNDNMKEDNSYVREEISDVIKDLVDPPVGSVWQNTLRRYLHAGEHFYRKASSLAAKIHCFESHIRRPYFHVQLLVEGELENWHQYLDFVEKQGDLDWIVKIYERCLIPCAFYPEFWMRYVELMEAKGGREIAKLALDRATQIFLKRVPEIHLFCARFKEQIGDICGARAALGKCISDVGPGFIDNVRRKANMEKRQGNVEAALALYRNAVEVMKEKQNLQTLPMLLVHFSQFAYMVTDDADKARDILINGLKYLPLSILLLEELIHFEKLHGGPRKIDVLDSIIAQATAPGPAGSEGLSSEDREHISNLFLEFVDICGTASEIKKAWNRHRNLFHNLMRPTSFHKSYSQNVSMDKAMACGSTNLAQSDCVNIDYITDHPNQQKIAASVCQKAVSQNTSLDISNNDSNEESGHVEGAVVDKKHSRLDALEQHAALPDMLNECSNHLQTPPSLRENKHDQAESREASDPLSELRLLQLETLSINPQQDELEHSDNASASANDSKFPEVTSIANTGAAQDSCSTINITTLSTKASTEAHEQQAEVPQEQLHLDAVDKTSPHYSNNRVGWQQTGFPSEAHGNQGLLGSSPNHSNNRVEWRQTSFASGAPGNQGLHGSFQSIAQHPQQQWQVSPEQQNLQCEMQSQMVMSQGYSYEQYLTGHDPRTLQTMSHYPQAPTLSNSAGAYLGQTKSTGKTFASIPQSLSGSTAVSQIQTPVYQYPVQYNEQLAQMQRNQGYQMWQYYQQQQQLLLHQQQQQQQLLLQSQQHNPYQLMEHQQQTETVPLQQQQLQPHLLQQHHQQHLQQQQQHLLQQHQQQQLQLQHEQLQLLQQQQQQQQQQLYQQDQHEQQHLQQQQHLLQQQQQLHRQNQQLLLRQQQEIACQMQTWNNQYISQMPPLQYGQQEQQFGTQAIGSHSQVPTSETNIGGVPVPNS